ncbi:MAG: hypothetical protein SH818_05885, partial [Saprospiraceae bacterium]|nr:hypothetical protein [Saprospiraceae bacterium]
MAKISIPPRVLPGFIELSSITPEQVEGISSFLNQMKVGTKFSDIQEYFQSILGIKSSRSIVNTLSTFGEILEPTQSNFEDLTNDLIESVIELTTNEKEIDLSESKILSLKNNLLEIFSNSNNLKLTLKAIKVGVENENLYGEASIISDIRLVFNDELEEATRNGIILHRLHINFRNKRKEDEIFLTLDLQDLKNLKENIERAVKKEEIIKINYSQNINFI